MQVGQTYLIYIWSIQKNYFGVIFVPKQIMWELIRNALVIVPGKRDYKYFSYFSIKNMLWVLTSKE